MVDTAQALAYEFAPLTVTVERGRLAFFARATGQHDPVYSSLEAARAAGHRDLPVPPSFFFSLDLERPGPLGWLADLGVDLGRVLHGEQSFSYQALAYAGDTLLLRSCITDVAVKKGGALELLTRRTSVTRASVTGDSVTGDGVSRDEEPVAEAVSVIVVQHAVRSAA